MTRLQKILGLGLLLCGAATLGACQRCGSEKPANFQEPATETKAADETGKTLTLSDAEETLFYGFSGNLRYAAVRMVEKDGAEWRVRVQALYLNSSALSDQGRFLSDIKTADLRRENPALTPADAKKRAIHQANEEAKAALVQLGFSDPLNVGKKLIDNAAQANTDKNPWPLSFAQKLTLPEGETGSLSGTIAVRPIALENRSAQGPSQEAALGLFASVEVPMPTTLPGSKDGATLTTVPRTLSKIELSRAGIVGYRLREATIDDSGKSVLAVIEAHHENGEISLLFGGNAFKPQERLNVLKQLQLSPQQNKRIFPLQRLTPSKASDKPAE